MNNEALVIRAIIDQSYRNFIISQDVRDMFAVFRVPKSDLVAQSISRVSRN